MDTTHDTSLLAALEQLRPHEHLCSIYESPEEHFAVAIPFVRIGLDRGEKCIYIADDGAEAVVRDAMATEGIDVERAIATHKLILAEKKDTYLKRGFFDPEWMFTFWPSAAEEARSQGFRALRVTGETEWVLRGAQGLERWLEYESRLTHMLTQHECLALCQYDRQLVPPELVLDVIRTHPTVIYRGVVGRNMYYVPPDELLGENQAAGEVERLLTNLREREQVESRLWEQREQLAGLSRRLIEAQEAERRSVARELHDDFGQLLTALRLNLQKKGADPGESIELVDQAIGHIRDLVLDLRPSILDDLGLAPALRWYGAREGQRAGLDFRLIAELDERLTPPVEITCFRLVQEALTNVVRHAQARGVTVTLTTAPGEVRLEVSDDGRGFDPVEARRRAASGKSQGLMGMQERVSLAGGELAIDAGPGRGTTIRARFPRNGRGGT